MCRDFLVFLGLVYTQSISTDGQVTSALTEAKLKVFEVIGINEVAVDNRLEEFRRVLTTHGCKILAIQIALADMLVVPSGL